MAVLLMLFLLAVPVLAQSPSLSSFSWWERPLVRDLALTDEQRADMTTILREYRGRMIDLRAAVSKAEAGLEDLFNSQDIDETKSRQAIDELVDARGEMTRVFAEMSLELRHLLTPEQWQMLQERRQQQLRQGRQRDDRTTPNPPDAPSPPRSRRPVR